MKKSILLIAVAMMLVLSQCKKNDIGKNNNEISFGRYYVESAEVKCQSQEDCHKHVTKVTYGVLDYVNDDVIGFDDL